jgi:hypothetical protein
MFDEVCQTIAVGFVYSDDFPSGRSTVGSAYDSGVDENIVRLTPILKRDVHGRFGSDGDRMLPRRAPACVRQIPDDSIHQRAGAEVAELALNGSS